MRFVTEKEFNLWVKDMVKSYNNRGKEFQNVRKLTLDPAESNGRTIIMNTKTGKTAVAKLHKDDKYSPGIGLAVAWAKYRNREIPVVATNQPIQTLNFLDTFYFTQYQGATKYQYIGEVQNGVAYMVIRNVENKEVKMITKNEAIKKYSQKGDGYIWKVEG